MNAQKLIGQANAVGVALRLVNGKVKARGHADAVALMVDQLRASKSDLISWFTETAANDSDQIIESTCEPGAWGGLAVAYHQHHFQCATCQVADRGVQYGGRCEVGAARWLKYTGVVDLTTLQSATCHPQTAATDHTTPDDSD